MDDLTLEQRAAECFPAKALIEIGKVVGNRIEASDAAIEAIHAAIAEAIRSAEERGRIAEREACAKVAEDAAAAYASGDSATAAQHVAAAIRSRKEDGR